MAPTTFWEGKQNASKEGEMKIRAHDAVFLLS